MTISQMKQKLEEHADENYDGADLYARTKCIRYIWTNSEIEYFYKLCIK